MMKYNLVAFTVKDAICQDVVGGEIAEENFVELFVGEKVQEAAGGVHCLPSSAAAFTMFGIASVVPGPFSTDSSLFAHLLYLMAMERDQ